MACYDEHGSAALASPPKQADRWANLVSKPSPSPLNELNAGQDDRAVVDQEPAALTGTSPRTWSRSFPATADQVREARLFLSAILADWPHAADALICLSELASNSILHSNSRRPGGRFIVRASLNLGMLRVEVQDDGGPWQDPHDQDGRHGHGLTIVNGLSSNWSVWVDGPDTRSVWFKINYHASSCRAPRPACSTWP
jgi:serine/threonine-protein kinase RsbW